MSDKPISIHPDGKQNTTLDITNEDVNRYISECQSKKENWSEFFLKIAQNIDSEDRLKQYAGLSCINRLLNDDEDAPIDEGLIQNVIDAGFIPKLLNFMQKDDEPRLQVEAIWALTSITGGSSDQVQEIVDHGALPIIIKLLHSCHSELVGYAVFAIANIAEASPHRDTLLENHVLHPLIDMLKQALVNKDMTLIRQGTVALSNLCRVKPLPVYEKVADATPVLCTVVQKVTDIETLRDALWALFSLSDSEHKLARVLETDVFPSLVRYLDCSDISVSSAISLILGNIISLLEDDQADVVLKGPLARSYVKKSFGLLKNRADNPHIRCNICWSLSNITCKGSDYIDLVIGKTEYIEQLIHAALYDILEVQREAVRALKNAIVNANPKQMILMTRGGVFDCLCKLIQQDLPDNEIIISGLLGLATSLEFAALMSRKEATNNKYLIKMKQNGALKQIEQFRESEEEELPVWADGIWSNHLRVPLLRRKITLKKAMICFKNERHSLSGIFQNKKKRLAV